ncbi:MAG: 30S ribosomal protein S6 [Chloroflexota bacterium]
MATSEPVAEVGNGQWRDYELVVVISPELAGEALDAMVDGVSQFVTEKGGVVDNVERWGERKLAYPIKHFLEGSYVLTKFKLKPEMTKELEAKLQISEGVLRHLLVRLNG